MDRAIRSLTCMIDKKMVLYELNENDILEELTEVTTAKRVASMVSSRFKYSNVLVY